MKAWVKQILTGGAAAAPAGRRCRRCRSSISRSSARSRSSRSAASRRSRAPRLHATWVNLPHVTQFDEADITELEAERAKLKDKAAAAGVKLTPLAFIVRACVLALQEFPTFNASLDRRGENVVLKKYMHIGFAADTPNGLLVPVIRDADKTRRLRHRRARSPTCRIARARAR